MVASLEAELACWNLLDGALLKMLVGECLGVSIAGLIMAAKGGEETLSAEGSGFVEALVGECLGVSFAELLMVARGEEETLSGEGAGEGGVVEGLVGDCLGASIAGLMAARGEEETLFGEGTGGGGGGESQWCHPPLRGKLWKSSSMAKF